jgi:Cu-processing system permease protein
VRKVVAIAYVTVREAFRQRLAVNLLLFAVALLAASLTISTLTFGEQYRIIANLGLSAMEVVGTLIAAFLGAGLIAGEVARRTLYPVLAKAVTRPEYLVGRYLGLVATVSLNLLVMAIVFGGVLFVYQGGAALRESPFLLVVAAMAVQFAMVAAVATFFSTFSTTTLSAIFTLSVVVAGYLSSDLVRYWSKQGKVADGIGKVAYVLVPNLEALNLKEAMVYKDPVAASFAWTGIGYGLLYAMAVIAFASAVFSRRDLR